MLKRIGSALLGLVLLAAAFPALAASVPQMCGPAGGPPGCTPVVSTVGAQALPDLNGLVNSINSNITPQSMASFASLRNYLDNGAMAVAQRGTSAITGGTTAGCVVAPATSSYVADEWCVDTNVSSGAGKGQIVTSTPSPLAGFQNSMNVWRDSGALTQPVCAEHEVLTSRSVQLAGQTVTFSVWLQALAGLNADNGSAANLYIIYGTGTDQGLQTMTASPAITPAWTGINSSITKAITLTTSWAQYSVTGTIPTGTKEVGVQICFTPTATGAGTTDGFAMVAAQLEQGAVASSFEFRPYPIDLYLAQTRYWTITEPAASVSIAPSGQGASTTTCILSIPLPVQMRAVPTAGFLGTALAGTTWTVTHVVTNTALSTPFLAATAGGSTVNELNLTATTGASLTAGQTCTLTGAGGGSILGASADL